jgi:hypothetical protein
MACFNESLSDFDIQNGRPLQSLHNGDPTFIRSEINAGKVALLPVD